MTMLALLSQAVPALPPGTLALVGPYVISSGALAAGVFGALRATFVVGRFVEWKEGMEKEKERLSSERQDLVPRSEMELIVRHIDQRFDSLDKRLDDFQKIKTEVRGI